MTKNKAQKTRIGGRFGSALAFMVLLFANFPVQAQYESFFGRETWKYGEVHGTSCYMDDYDPTNIACGCCFTEYYTGHRDDTATIGGYVYFRSESPYALNLPLELFLREDTVGGRLFMRTSRDDNFPEYLICDLSLSQGDTFHLPCEFTYSLWSDTLQMVVDSVRFVSGKKVIDLSLLDNSDYRAFFYHEDYSDYYSHYNVSLRFMEGVGPIYGIYPTTNPYLGLLLCLHKDDTLYYMTHEDFGCYQSEIWGVPDYPQSSMIVYPNPVGQIITINFTEDMEVDGTVLIRDMTGCVRQCHHVTEKHVTLNVSFLPPGVYLLTYWDAENRKITKKIVKQ